MLRIPDLCDVIAFTRGHARRGALASLGLAALAAALWACDVEPMMRVGTNIWPGYEPLYIARDNGYLDSAKVKLVEYHSSRDVSRAFANGSIEVAALTLDEALLLLERGVQLKVFLVADVSRGADTIIGQPELKTLEDVQGKRVGAEIGALGAYVLRRALQKHHMSVDRIRIVALSPDEDLQAFQSRSVDAVVTFEPVRSALLALGGRELFTSREIPDEVVDVLVVQSDFASEHPAMLNDLAAAWFKAVDFVVRDPDAAVEHLQRRAGLAPNETQAIYAGLKLADRMENARFLEGDSPILVQTARLLRREMVNMGLLKQAPDVDGMVLAEPLNQAGR